MGSRSSDEGSIAVRLRDLTISDCISLASRLREIDQSELILLSKEPNPDSALIHAWLVSDISWAWEVDGVVEACGGICTAKGFTNGWLVCSKDATKDKALFHRWAKAALWLLVSKYPSITTDTMVSSNHWKWLEHLGFEPGREFKVDGFLFRRYTGWFDQE